MAVFLSAARLSSWSGLCPGNRRSAGKDQGGRTTRGNRWLGGMLTQCAWAAVAKKDRYLKGKFWRLAAEGKKRTLVAVAHNLVVLIYHVLRQGKPYQERRAPVLDERVRHRLIRHHPRCLGRLGVSRRVQQGTNAVVRPCIFGAAAFSEPLALRAARDPWDLNRSFGYSRPISRWQGRRPSSGLLSSCSIQGPPGNCRAGIRRSREETRTEILIRYQIPRWRAARAAARSSTARKSSDSP
jgi:hypothetical protein